MKLPAYTSGTMYSCPRGRVYADHLLRALAQCEGPQAEANAQLFASASALVLACLSALQSPGINTTDQSTGETYATALLAALAKAGVVV